MPRRNWALLATLITAVGCGGDGSVAVSGRVLENGSGYVMAGDEVLNIRLESSAIRYQAVLTADGGFTVASGSGGGVLPGKYEVTVISFREGSNADKYKNRYAPGKSPLKLEVAPAPKEQRFTIDLTAGTVTPG